MPAVTLARLQRAGWAWVVALAVVFTALAVTVDSGALHMSDRVLLFIAQAPAGKVLDWAMALVSLTGSAEVTGVLVLGLVAFNRGLPWRSWERWLPLLVFGLVTLIEVGGKLVIHQPSPPLDLLRGPKMPGVGMDTGYSFPSGHMTRVAMVFGLIALRLARRTRQPLWLWACVVAIWIVGFSRVYLGEHWPADVAGGILLGGAGIALCIALSPSGAMGDLEGLLQPAGG